MSTCPVCGGIDHHMPDCWIGNGTLPTVVYDLAEFERQLEAKRQDLRDRRGHYNHPTVEALDAVLDALQASRKTI